MGSGAADSLSYKTAMAQANKGYKLHSDANNQYAAASGMSDEAKLGQMATMNDGYNSQQLNSLSIADQERKRLQQQRDAVMMQLSGMQTNRAGQLGKSQQQMSGGLMAMVPYLLDKPKPVGTQGTQGGGSGGSLSSLGSFDPAKYAPTTFSVAGKF